MVGGVEEVRFVPPKILKPAVVLGAACAAFKGTGPKVEPAGTLVVGAAGAAGFPNWKTGAVGVKLAAVLGAGFGEAPNRNGWLARVETGAVSVVLWDTLGASGTPSPKLKAGFVLESVVVLSVLAAVAAVVKTALGRPVKTEVVSVVEVTVRAAAGAG